MLTTGKRRTREHVIADLSVNYFERPALLCGYTVDERGVVSQRLFDEMRFQDSRKEVQAA